jgi:hypothetical protein
MLFEVLLLCSINKSTGFLAKGVTTGHMSFQNHIFHRQSRPSRKLSMSSDYTAVMIVPTGIGASIGGYAGDALPSAKLISTVVDTLITHPNVLNGAMMYWPMENVLYVEGYALDEFASGMWYVPLDNFLLLLQYRYH